MARKTVIDQVLDVEGFLCPIPTIITSKVMQNMEKGKTLKIITKDITTKKSIPALCVNKGYKLLNVKEKDGFLYFIILK